MTRPQTTDNAGHIVELAHVYRAPRERVFQAFLEPAQIARWWGPDGFRTPADRIAVDATTGGSHHKVMVLDSPEIAAGMGMAVGAEFPDVARIEKITPPELLVLSSDPQPALGLVERTVTRIEFHAEGSGGTRVTLVDGPYSQMMASHAATGWAQSFLKLERYLMS